MARENTVYDMTLTKNYTVIDYKNTKILQKSHLWSTTNGWLGLVFNKSGLLVLRRIKTKWVTYLDISIIKSHARLGPKRKSTTLV